MTVADIPFTKTVSNHGLIIFGPNGKVLGGIVDWQVNAGRGGRMLYEFGGATTGQDDVEASSGEPFEIVPGNSTGTTITIRRYDIYIDRFVEAFGTDRLDTLAKQRRPIDVREVLQHPDGSVVYTAKYYGFWFTSMGTNHTADGDRVVQINAQAMYTRKREL